MRGARLPPRAAESRGSGGIGRATSAVAERVSDDLRRGSGPLLRSRRRAAGLMLAASGCMGLVALYQFGLLRHLPDPPGFDSDRVDASGEAFQSLKTPDATLGLASYAATLALLGMGSADRAHERPWIPLLAAAKTASDAAGGLVLAVEQATKHRTFCFWCVLATAASVAAVPQTLPEARVAWRRLRGD